jgi:hypothetical protein
MKQQIEVLLGKKCLKDIALDLGISKSTLKRRMSKYGLKQPKEFAKKLWAENSKKGGEVFGNKVRKTPEEKKITKDLANHRRGQIGYYKRYTATYRKRNLERKKKAVEYKGGKCQECGYKKCIAALEFHHRDPNEKDFEISNGARNWDKIKAELDKCDLLCSNCHKEVHYAEPT